MNIQLGLNKDIDKAREIIYQRFPEKNVKIEELDYNSRCFFNITPVRYKSIKDFYNRVTDLILDLILNIYSGDIIHRYVSTNYKDLKPAEKKEIYVISKKLLLDKENFLVEKQYISNLIKKYILDIPIISIDGFIIFRLKGLDFFIKLVVDKGIEEFTAKKEYREFISILRYFVDIQESKYNLVNLRFEGDDYTLLDDKDNKIDKNYFEDIIYQIDEDGISQDDLLISTLIILAPKVLIIHLNQKSKDSDIVRIITDVFGERAYFCLGCEKCREELKIKNTK